MCYNTYYNTTWELNTSTNSPPLYRHCKRQEMRKTNGQVSQGIVGWVSQGCVHTHPNRVPAYQINKQNGYWQVVNNWICRQYWEAQLSSITIYMLNVTWNNEIFHLVRCEPVTALAERNICPTNETISYQPSSDSECVCFPWASSTSLLYVHRTWSKLKEKQHQYKQTSLNCWVASSSTMLTDLLASISETTWHVQSM